MPDLDYSKISITAKVVAYYRQFSDIPFASDVSDFIGAREAIEEITKTLAFENGEQKEIFAEEIKIYAPILEMRYKSVVGLIQKSGINQILELASGFSLRGLSMAKNKNISYVETDLSGINAEKNRLLTVLQKKYDIGDFGNHHIISANALDRSQLEQATTVLNQKKPIAIVNEGLIPYLSTNELSNLAQNIRYVISQFAGGTWITPDFTTTSMTADVSEYIVKFRQAISGTTNRQIYQDTFDSEESIKNFLKGHGFNAHYSSQVDEASPLISPSRVNVKPQDLNHIKAQMKIWTALPTR